MSDCGICPCRGSLGSDAWVCTGLLCFMPAASGPLTVIDDYVALIESKLQSFNSNVRT
jgi:hypothetical protein